MALTYALGTVGTRAHDFVRLLLKDTRVDRPLLDDAELDALLLQRGLQPGSDPVANASACYYAAAEAAEAIQARYAQDSSIALTAEGPVKSLAASAFAQLARTLRARGDSGAVVSFAEPSEYAIDSVTGVDSVDDGSEDPLEVNS